MRRIGLTLVPLLLFGCGSDQIAAPADELLGDGSAEFSVAGHASQITVMSQNMYLGAPVEPILYAPADQVPVAVAVAWAIVQATDLPARVWALADEIAKAKPDVIGLQEVTTFYVETPSDIVAFDATSGEVVQIGYPIPNASTVAIDFLPGLLTELAAHGITYHAAAKVLNSDLEMPRYDGLAPEGYPTFSDVRLQDYDVLLVRDGVSWDNAWVGNFNTVLELNPFQVVRRGFAAADVTVMGTTYRVVSTHLESDNETTKRAQAQELVDSLADETKPLIVVGDFNSGPGRTAPGGQQTYDYLLGEGYGDMWLSRTGAPSDGFTCCHAGDLSNTTPEGWLTERIDLMLLGNLAGAAIVQAWLVGNDEKDLTRYGVWPSDHAGLVARMTFVPSRGMSPLALQGWR